MNVTSKDYYLRRERQERDLADKAVNPQVCAIHEQLAGFYHGLAIRSEPDAPAQMSVAIA